MNQTILCYAPSKHGKTASLRNLNPSEVGIINCDKKPLPLAGWVNNFVTVYEEPVGGKPAKPDLAASNYVETDKPNSVLATLRAWEARSDIKYIAIDTITHLISAEYIRNAVGKDYVGYMQMGKSVYHILDYIRDMQTNVVVYGHTMTSMDDFGTKTVKLKSQGKMIDNFEPASYFTTVLTAMIKKTDEGENRYLFRTKTDGFDSAALPVIFDNGVARDLLPEFVENDIKLIFDALDRFDVGNTAVEAEAS